MALHPKNTSHNTGHNDEKPKKKRASDSKPPANSRTRSHLNGIGLDSSVLKGAGGGKGVGRVKVTKSISLAESATGKPAKVNARVTRDSDEFSPAGELKKSKDKRASEPQLAKGLTAIAAGVRPGRTSIGAAVSGGLTGAALGATVGESIDRNRRNKAEAKVAAAKKKKDEAKNGKKT